MDGMRRDNLAHIDRLGLARRTEEKCAVCGKTFYKTIEHIYKHNRRGKELFECSWTCYRAMEREIGNVGGKHSRVVFTDDADDAQEEVKPMSRIEVCKAKIEHYRKIYATTKEKSAKGNARSLMKVWQAKLRDAEWNAGGNK